MDIKVIEAVDSYKLGHYNQYQDDTEAVYSYFESRNGAQFDETVFFGLQALIKKYLIGVVVTQEDVDEAAKVAAIHFGNPDIFNKKGWEYIVNECDGKLPLRIRAVPEGTPVTINNVLMTVENTDPNCYWLTNYVETLLTQVWYPCNVATLSRHVKKMMKKYLEDTAETLDALPFMLHDFGCRGATTMEAAQIGGMAHIVNFMGTDTVPALTGAMRFYNAEVCAFSVPATEHSVMTALGPEGECDIFEQLLDKYPTGILSVVGDSYDIFNAAEHIVGTSLKDRILERDGVFVLRPDSGELVSTVLRLLEILGRKFGTTENAKGYKILNPKVKILWGDGLDYTMIEGIMWAMKKERWSIENIVFGMGGGLLQKHNRDTQRNAFKCCAQKRDGVWYDIFKDPLDKSKVSKRGKLGLKEVNGKFVTVEEKDNELLQTVFENGELVTEYTFNQVRANAAV